MSVSFAVSGQVTAALIAAGVAATAAVANIYITLRTRSQDRIARATERHEDVLHRRREASDAQRREVFGVFVLSCEELAHRLQREINLGDIGYYTIGAELHELAISIASDEAEASNVPSFENPMRTLDTSEAVLLRELGIRARASRGMVQIVGPRLVGEAATAYERDLNRAVEQVIERDPEVAETLADHLVDSRLKFFDAANSALDPDSP